MSLRDWYLHKAAQCAQRAQRASDPGERSNLKDEKRIWLQIANEELRKASRRRPINGKNNQD
jgi:hypothetical protein